MAYLGNHVSNLGVRYVLPHHLDDALEIRERYPPRLVLVKKSENLVGFRVQVLGCRF